MPSRLAARLTAAFGEPVEDPDEGTLRCVALRCVAWRANLRAPPSLDCALLLLKDDEGGET